MLVEIAGMGWGKVLGYIYDGDVDLLSVKLFSGVRLVVNADRVIDRIVL